MVDELNDPVQQLLDDLFAGYGFDNLTAQKRFHIHNKDEAYVGERWMFLVKDTTFQQLYGHLDRHPHANATPTLFRAYLGEDGEQHFTEFVTNSFPLMKDGWRSFLEDSAFAFPNAASRLPALLSMLSDSLYAELEQFEIATTRENANRLLTARLALGSRLIPGATREIPNVVLDWLREGIDLQVLLYAFGPKGRSGPSKLAEPLIPLADAKAAAGIPLRRLQALYPVSEDDFKGF